MYGSVACEGSRACASHAHPASARQTCAVVSRSASDRKPILVARVSTVARATPTDAGAPATTSICGRASAVMWPCGPSVTPSAPRSVSAVATG
eukprot:1595586-Prymnesium_polylepis.1